MSIRKKVNASPGITAAAVLAVIALCGWFIWSQSVDASQKPAKAGFFTVDDGKTWFVDDLEKLPPYDKDGKQAVRAHLYKCEGSDQPIVGYLERYTNKGKDVTERFRSEQKANPGFPPKSAGEVAALGKGATEVKRPGDSTWVNRNDGAAGKIARFACPSGPTVAATP